MGIDQETSRLRTPLMSQALFAVCIAIRLCMVSVRETFIFGKSLHNSLSPVRQRKARLHLHANTFENDAVCWPQHRIHRFSPFFDDNVFG